MGKCKCKKGQQNKKAELKLRNKNGWGHSEIPSASAIRSAEQKLVGTLGDPKCKCKKVSGTKTAEQKQRN